MSDVGAPGQGPEPEMSPEQEQMLRQMEEEMRRIRVQDMVAQSVVSILNLSYRRIVKEDEQDLEQARVGIDAVRALVDSLEPEAQAEVKNALAQVQMIYAEQAGASGAAGAPAAPGGSPPADSGQGNAPAQPGGAGTPGQAPPRLWTPGSG